MNIIENNNIVETFEILIPHFKILLLEGFALLGFELIEFIKTLIIENHRKHNRYSSKLSLDTEIMFYTLTLIQIVISLALLNEIIYIVMGVSPLLVAKKLLIPIIIS